MYKFVLEKEIYIRDNIFKEYPFVHIFFYVL